MTPDYPHAVLVTIMGAALFAVSALFLWASRSTTNGRLRGYWFSEPDHMWGMSRATRLWFFTVLVFAAYGLVSFVWDVGVLLAP